MTELSYTDFLKSKVKMAPRFGFTVELSEINSALKPHQAAMVKWLVEGGRRACFAAFGLGKTPIQLEITRLVLQHLGGDIQQTSPFNRGLIVCPLGVRQEFQRDAKNLMGWSEAPEFIRRIEEADATGIYLTNYETIRDGKLDPRLFNVASLDEASILRGFGGTKTFREFMRLFTGDAGPTITNEARRNGQSVPYRFVATATPSPNEYIELLAYADFLGVMDTSQAKTRFFKRDSTKADQLTLHPHKEREFWLWVASWALFVQRPSDLGFSDEGYELPELTVRWHELPVDHLANVTHRDGQFRMFKNAAIGVQDAAREKRESLPARIDKMLELCTCMYCSGTGEVAASSSSYIKCPACDGRVLDSEHRIIWHDLEVERVAIEKAIPDAVAVYGSQDLDDREKAIADFSDGKIQTLAGKPVMLGSGCNFQRHCHKAIYLGIGFKFNDFIQSIHRLQRFLQEHPVEVDIIYTESEREVRKSLERKWLQHEEMTAKMTAIIKEFGLSQSDMAHTLTRQLGVERVEISGANYRIVNNDCVEESKLLKDNSVGLILTSIPFATQYEYSPNYADFGHSDNNEEFFRQMDYLTPELLRALKPGRIAAIHVKDRIVPSGMTGLGCQTVYPFHARCIEHYTSHGFAYMGMKTIVTDVVRENNQTYRLGWTEQCKDGSKMGVGMPEYLLLFRKPPSDTNNSYADEPVVKNKAAYSRSRWQIDAHGFARSAGNRLLTPEELQSLTHAQIFRMFRDFSLTEIYDFEHHVRIGEALEQLRKLPTTFMLLQPQSWSDEVWADITRMLTLNGAQHAKGKEMHLCPIQFDIVDRTINQFSCKGDTILDPFGGLMTVPYRAVLLGRYGVGFELNTNYFLDGAAYCRTAEIKLKTPTLFDLEEERADMEIAAMMS